MSTDPYFELSKVFQVLKLFLQDTSVGGQNYSGTVRLLFRIPFVDGVELQVHEWGDSDMSMMTL